MFVEFIGLPGSGKSTIIKHLRRLSGGTDLPFETLSQIADQVHRIKLEQPGYLKRKPGRGWFQALLGFAHRHPDAFRVLFENTLANSWENTIVMDVLGQYDLARQAKEPVGPILVDEGLLHRGAAAFLKEDAYSTLDAYLKDIPVAGVVVWLDIDVGTAIDRCKQRKKGLPRLYQHFSDAELLQHYEKLKALHRVCIDQQDQAGATIVKVDTNALLETNVSDIHKAISESYQKRRSNLTSQALG